MMLQIYSECKHFPYNQAVLVHVDRSQFASKHVSREKYRKEQTGLWYPVVGYLRWPYYMSFHKVTSHKLFIKLDLKIAVCSYPLYLWQNVFQYLTFMMHRNFSLAASLNAMNTYYWYSQKWPNMRVLNPQRSWTRCVYLAVYLAGLAVVS